MPPKPTILAFDTSAAHVAAALLFSDGKTHCKVEEMRKGQAESLLPILEDLLKQHSIKWADLAAIGVGVGPGNFTGIRISVAAARGLALALGRPAIGITGFETAAYCTDTPPPYRVAINGAGGQCYVQDFDAQGPNTAAVMMGVDQVPLTQMPVIQAEAISIEQRISAAAHLTLQRLDGPAAAPKPFYIKSPDAAPSKITPPKIVD